MNASRSTRGDDRAATASLRARWAPLRRFIRRHRRIVAGVLAGLAVLLIVGSLRPSATARTAIVTAATDLPAGRTLEPEDLSLADTTAVLPGARTDVDQVVGETLTSPMLAGEPVTTSRLMSHALEATEGLLVVPVQVADPAIAGLLEPGQILDLVAPGGRVVARGVRVVTVPRTSGSFVSGQDRAGQLVLVAVKASEAPRLAGAAQDPLSPVLW